MNFPYLIVGDIHATPSNLDEVRSLFTLIDKTCQENGTKTIILLGDQTDSHQIQNLAVMHMYKELFNQYRDLNFIILVGNHDRAVNGNKNYHSMFPYKSYSNVCVVDEFMSFSGFDVISYCRDEQEFLNLTKNKVNDILICHQEFNGCQYENGFYSKNGFDLSKVPYEQVISGHIHLAQKWDKIWYPGAPRWMTRSDANEDKYIFLWDGKSSKHISTGGFCRQIFQLNIKEGDAMPILDQNAKYILNVSGNRKFIQKIYEKYVGKAEIKTNVIDSKNVKVKESLGINKALEKFVLNDYVPQFGIDKEVLLKEVFGRLL